MIANTTTIGARSEFSLATVLFVAAFGAALLFSAGFAQPDAIHNVAHDTRHAAGFPCH
jgi:cobalt transporter subunit CbtB